MPATRSSMLLCHNWGGAAQGGPATCLGTMRCACYCEMLEQTYWGTSLTGCLVSCPPRETFQASRRMLLFLLSEQMPVSLRKGLMAWPGRGPLIHFQQAVGLHVFMAVALAPHISLL